MAAFRALDGRPAEVVIVFDPKGDADLLKRMAVEARRAGREREFYVFHLGWRYDRSYFDKIVASLLPLLEKLTTGKIAQLLAPPVSAT